MSVSLCYSLHFHHTLSSLSISSHFFLFYLVRCLHVLCFLSLYVILYCLLLTHIHHSLTHSTTHHTTHNTQTNNKQTNKHQSMKASNQPKLKVMGGPTLAPVCSLSHSSKLHKLTMPLNAQNQIGKRNITQTPHTITSVTKPTNQQTRETTPPYMTNAVYTHKLVSYH